MENEIKNETRKTKEPSFVVALIPLIFTILLFGVGFGVYSIKAPALLITASCVTGFIALILRFKWEVMQDGIVSSIHKALPAYLIIICVGILIGTWISSGTIPMLIYYGLELISPKYFLVTACFVCTVTSLATGTSWGTLGTLGVAFIGIAMSLEIPMGPAAGAIVAGAYFGDKMSPFSDVAILAPVCAGSNLFDHIKHMMWSATPAWLIGMVIYFIVGLRYGGGNVESELMTTVTHTLKENFNFNILILLPMIIVIYWAATKKPPVPGMLLSSFVAAIFAVIFQKATLPELATAMNTGYEAHTGVAEVDKLLSQGGMFSIMEVLLVAFTAFCLGGIMQSTGILSVILGRVMKLTQKVWSLVLTTIMASLVVALSTGSTFLSMILPGELLSPVYKKRGLAAKNLSRIIEESGAINTPLIPWSMAGVFIAEILGVPTLQYLPWAIMNYLSVVFLAIYGFTGFTMAPKIRDDETQIGS